MTDIERCDKEIAEAQAMLHAGHRDIEGLLQQLMDWAIERRLLSGARMEAKWV